jgi:beta-glucanase (GH16 family)
VYATDYQPNPDNGVLDLTEVLGYSFGIVTSPSSGQFFIDDVVVYGGSQELTVDFSSDAYTVGEADGTAMITVNLSASSVDTVTVDYATVDGSATAGADYVAASDTLTFTPGITTLNFTVAITDDLDYDPDETIVLSLSNPVSVTIGGNNPAQLTIIDDEPEPDPTVIDDFESGMPPGFVGFADSWDGSGSATSLAYSLVDMALPVIPAVPGNTVLEITYTVVPTIPNWGGAPGYAGVTRDFAATQSWLGYEGFSLWIYGSNSGGTHRIELKADGLDATNSNRYAFSYADDFSGWKFFNIPFSNFIRRYDWNPGPSPDDPINLGRIWGYSLLLDAGSSGTMYMDHVALVEPLMVANFEGGLPSGFVGFADTWDGSGSSTSLMYGVEDLDLITVPAALTNTTAVMTYSVALTIPNWGGAPGYAGVTHDFASAQDWSDYHRFTMWIHGGNSGAVHLVELKADGDDAFNSNRYVFPFTDDFTGWKLFTLPFTDFAERTGWNPGPSPSDPINTARIWGYSILLASGSSGVLNIDEVMLLGIPVENRVDFTAADYSVGEADGTAAITVALTAASPDTITVEYATVDGTAMAGNDYVAVSGTLEFAPGDLLETFVVTITDDSEYDPDETVVLSLSNSTAPIGGNNPAVLTIVDDEAADFCSVRATMIDDFEIEALPQGTTTQDIPIGFHIWSDPSSSVEITLTDVATGTGDALPGQGAINTVLQVTNTIVSWGGFSHYFEDETVTEWVPQDWSTYEGISFWIFGHGTGDTLFVEIRDNRTLGSTSDDSEVWSYDFPDDFTGWQYFEIPFADFYRKEIGNGAPNDGFGRETVHGWALGSLTSTGTQTRYIDNVRICGFTTPDRDLEVAFYNDDFDVSEGEVAVVTAHLNMDILEPLTVTYTTEPAESGNAAIADRDYTPVSGTLIFPAGTTVQTFTVSTMDDNKYEGSELLRLRLSDPSTGTLGSPYRARLYINENDPYNPTLIDDFESFPYHFDVTGTASLYTTEFMTGTAMALPGQGQYENVLSVTYGSGEFGPNFAQGEDWSSYSGLTFWYYGSNSGDEITVQIFDNRAEDPGPDGWELIWSDEFDGAAGTSPDVSNWTHEIGDGFDQNIIGWGNGELEYYTASTANSALDGSGNLVITATEIDTATTSLECWYGPCEYTSARLISDRKFETAYGRIEARIDLPEGQGLWPAFWMLGDNIGEVGWPQCGEIDIMEYVGYDPDHTHGALHGPGYSGGNNLGGDNFLADVADSPHLFAVEWEPGVVRWYVDDTIFMTKTITDAVNAGGTWVFDHPFYIIMNVAVGGNWPGSPDETTVFPQNMIVDYVRVYGAPDTAERFEYTFTDNLEGWQRVVIPFAWFERSVDQPVGAPDDGLNLTDVWGYDFAVSDGSGSTRADSMFYLDQVRLTYLYYFPIIRKDF